MNDFRRFDSKFIFTKLRVIFLIFFAIGTNATSASDGEAPICVPLKKYAKRVPFETRDMERSESDALRYYLSISGSNFEDSPYIYNPTRSSTGSRRASTIILPKLPCFEICTGYIVINDAKKWKVFPFVYKDYAIFYPGNFSIKNRTTESDIFELADGGFISVYDSFSKAQVANPKEEKSFLPVSGRVKIMSPSAEGVGAWISRHRGCFQRNSEGR